LIKDIKQFAWFLIKSPQRKIVGYYTLLTDLKGLLHLCFSSNPNEKLWICIGIYNRTEKLLNELIPSLLKTSNPSKIALSIVDCGSDDFEILKSKIQKNWPHELIISQKVQPFSRAAIFNLAIKQAPGNFIMTMDADMKVPENLYSQAKKQVRKGRAWFPICQWQMEENKGDWRWFTEGTGIFAALKSDFEKAGCYNEDFKEWGKEDWDLFFAFYRNGISPARNKQKGLYHTWHKSLKPEGFEKWF